jgi:hypothetical protein
MQPQEVQRDRDLLDGRRLTIDVVDATPDERARGLAAAQAVFDRAGVTAWDAAVGYHNRSCETFMLPFLPEGDDPWEEAAARSELRAPELTAEDHRRAELWSEAEAAALEACCATWAVKPESAGLALLPDPGQVHGDYKLRLLAAGGEPEQTEVRPLGAMTLRQAITAAEQVWTSDPRIKEMMQGYWIVDADGRIAHTYNEEFEQEKQRSLTGVR